MRTFPWTQFLVFVAAGLIGTAAVIPYSLSMNQKALEKLKASGRSAESGVKKLPPMPVMVLLSTVQGLLLVGIATFVGLLAAGQVGLGAPVLEAALAGRSVADQILALLPVTLLLAIVSGVVMMALEAWYFMPRLPRQLTGVDHRTAFWKRVLACFYDW